MHLIGVNRAGTEYACAQGWGIFDGPEDPASIAAMAAWGINAVRVPLNEDCWLGINVPPRFSGAAYRNAIGAYVRALNDAGLYAVVDLHWGAPGSAPALSQEAMPDASHAVAFWRSVARTFRFNHDVLFDLFNEPHSVSWRCWEWGCAMPGGWRAVGMQTLVDTVRAAGNTDPVILEGLEWGNDLTGFDAHRPTDPARALLAGFHVYPKNSCRSTSCWDAELLPVARHVPVATTEVGDTTCTAGFVSTYLGWARAHAISALAWTWNTNEGCLALITNYLTGTPTAYGAGVEASIAKVTGNRALAARLRHDHPAGS